MSALTAVAGLQPPCSWRRLPPSMGLCYCLISKHTSRTRHEPQPLKAREQVREGSLKELSGANKNSQRIYITTGSSRRRLISPLRACAVRCAMLAAAEPSAVAAIGDLAAGPHEQAPAPRLPIPLPPRRHIAPRVHHLLQHRLKCIPRNSSVPAAGQRIAMRDECSPVNMCVPSCTCEAGTAPRLARVCGNHPACQACTAQPSAAPSPVAGVARGVGPPRRLVDARLRGLGVADHDVPPQQLGAGVL